MVFLMGLESERDFGIIILLFSIAPLSGVQLENRDVNNGGSSSHQNELILRDNSGHSNNPRDSNNM
jgi:hypothetical protein